MNKGDGDVFRCLPLHAEVRIRATDVPWHNRTRFDPEHLAGLHRCIGWDQRGVRQGNVPRGGGRFARFEHLDSGGCFQFHTRCGHVHLDIEPIVVLANFLHVVLWVNDERQRRGACNLGSPRPHHHLARASTQFDGGAVEFNAVHLKGDGEGVGLHVTKIEERRGELDRIIDLRDADVHGKIFGNNLRIGSKIVDAVTEHRNGVGLGFGATVLCVFHLDRPCPRARSIKQDNFQIVDAVPRPTGGRPSAFEVVTQVGHAVG